MTIMETTLKDRKASLLATLMALFLIVASCCFSWNFSIGQGQRRRLLGGERGDQQEEATTAIASSVSPMVTEKIFGLEIAASGLSVDVDSVVGGTSVLDAGGGASSNPELVIVSGDGKLSRCEGDCDDDDDCDDGLICFQRSGTTPVPGCSGEGSSGRDYCIVPPPPTAAPTEPPTPSPTSPPTFPPTDPLPPLMIVERPLFVDNSTDSPTFPPLTNIDRDTRRSRDDGKYHLCEGDCDGDSDCGEGLVCYSRSGTTAVPGCSGLGESGDDYCIKPESLAYLDICEGDCDGSDALCLGNLTCYRGGGSRVPGCSGEKDSSQNYCVDPDASFQVSKNSFRLRLYWEDGYDWQDSSREKWYCMECEGSCRRGNDIELGHCDEDGSIDDNPDIYFEFLNLESDGKTQLRLSGSDSCVGMVSDSGDDSSNLVLSVVDCDASSSRQFFTPSRNDLGWDDYRFEIKTSSGRCISQEHHPKKNEDLYATSCSTARGDDTSYWMKW